MQALTQEKRSVTRVAEATMLSAKSFSEGIKALEGSLISTSIRDYFNGLLIRHSISHAGAVRAANLDKDFGRQILTGDRMARRDYYLQLAFGMSLTFEETQSMLNFMGRGPIYAVRQRDAALMFALQRGMSLMDVQLLLEEHGLTPLGDDENSQADNAFSEEAPVTRDIEQRIKEACSFQDLSAGAVDRFLEIAINNYFAKLLSARNMTRAQVLARAEIKENIGYQLLSGLRIAKNRDAYVRLALALSLTLAETQQMLKFLKKGALYPLIRRDAAFVFGIGQGYSIGDMQKLLTDYGLPELS